MDDVLVWLAGAITAYWIARLIERTLFEVRFRDAAFKGIDATSKAAENYIGADADWIVHVLSGLGAREETIRATVTQAATATVMATVCSMYDQAWKFSSRRRQLKPILDPEISKKSSPGAADLKTSLTSADYTANTEGLRLPASLNMARR